MNKEKNSLEQNIDEIKEWQDHQYDPGYSLGGNIPPYLLRKNKKLGLIFLVTGFICLTLIILNFSFLDTGQQIYSTILIVLTLFAGFSKLKGN